MAICGYSIHKLTKSNQQAKAAATTIKAISGLTDIAGSYGNLRCKEAANAMQNYLKKHNLHGSLIKIWFPPIPGYIVCVSQGDRVISENGAHYGILFDGKVYCNVHPEGMLKDAWINDFEGVGNKLVVEEKF